MENTRRDFNLSHRCRQLLACCLSLAAGLLVVAHAADLQIKADAVAAHGLQHAYEDSLIQALDAIRRADIDAAIKNIEPLTRQQPDFRLAQLVYADLLLAKARGIKDFGNFYAASFQQIAALRHEARVRWQHHQNPPDQRLIPSALIQLSKHQRFAIVVDLSASRLYLFENHAGVPAFHSDYYISIGKNGIGKYIEGDQKTPTGVYFVTDYIDAAELPDLYGDGAFPIDYPNAWDVRHKRTGYGIWLHGTPSNTYTRPPRDSDGCVIMSNDDFRAISRFVDVKATPVILTENIDWIQQQTWQARRAQYQNFLEQWRTDWESRDAEKYLSHYSTQYYGLGNDYQSWVAYKRQVNPSKQFIEVNLYNTSMFLYPGDDNLLVVTFEQDYHSDNFKRRFIKRQYWRMEPDGKWRIVYEGNVS